MSGFDAFIRANLLIRWGLEPPDFILRKAPLTDRSLWAPRIVSLEYELPGGMAKVEYDSPRWLGIDFWGVYCRLWVRIERKIARTQLLANFPIPPVGGVRVVRFRRVRVKGILTRLKDLHGKLRVQMDCCTIYREGHGIVQGFSSNIKEIVI
jgi:hypothetical protein